MKAVDGGRRKKRRSPVNGETRALKCHLERDSIEAEAPPTPRCLAPDERLSREESRCSVGDEIVSDRWRVYSCVGGGEGGAVRGVGKEV